MIVQKVRKRIEAAVETLAKRLESGESYMVSIQVLAVQQIQELVICVLYNWLYYNINKSAFYLFLPIFKLRRLLDLIVAYLFHSYAFSNLKLGFVVQWCSSKQFDERVIQVFDLWYWKRMQKLLKENITPWYLYVEQSPPVVI